MTTLAVLGFLTLMLVGSRVIQLFGKVAHGGLDVSFLLPLVLYKLASVLVLLLPLSFFIGLMLVFGRLYVDQEITITQSSGLSPRKLALMMWPLVLALVLLQSFLSLYAADWGERKSELALTEQAIRGAFDAVKPKTFVRSGDYSLYVGAIDKQKRELLDIMLIQKNGTKGPSGKPRDVIILAKRAAQAGVISEEVNTETHTGKQAASTMTSAALVKNQPETEETRIEQTTMLDLYNGRRYELGADQLVYNEVGFAKYRLSFNQIQKHKQDNLELPAQSSLSLWQRRTDADAKAELGFRLSLPLVMLLAWMLAVPLSKVRPRQGRWVRLLPSILFFATSVVVLISLKGSVASGRVPVVTNLAVILLYIGVAVFAYNTNKLKKRKVSIG